MVVVEHERWNQSVDELRRAALESDHARTRERFQALYFIATGQFNATACAEHIQRSDETVLGWVHLYNELGPDALIYRRSGGRKPSLAATQAAQVVATLENSEPADHGITGHLWTVKKLRLWIYQRFGQVLSRSTIRAVLVRAGMSWKKVKKLLGRAKPEKRQEYVEKIFGLYEKSLDGEVILIWVDEVHVHREMDEGYTWGKVGKRVYRRSDSPGLSERLNFYGAYDHTHGQCLLWQNGRCNGANTVLFLEEIVKWCKGKKGKVVIVWDNSPVHTAKIVKAKAEALGIELVYMPAYSPDLNPIEGLWDWMREEVTRGYCHPTVSALEQACHNFITEINMFPEGIVDRLPPPFSLDPEIESKLQVPI